MDGEVLKTCEKVYKRTTEPVAYDPMSSLPPLPDTHIHIIPPTFRAALEEKGDRSGYHIPEYSTARLKTFLTSLNITHPILSVTAPGPPIFGPSDAGRKIARKLNEEVAEEVDRLVAEGRNAGFFASLPDFNDVEGVLEEITWVFGTQKKANGVIMLTNYGEKLMADISFRPIWEKLNEVKALVFVHPTSYSITPHEVGNFLPQPVVDYPHATMRAAVDLVMSGTFRACPDIDVILSHAGGTLPFLASRAFVLFDIPGIKEHSKVSKAEAQEDAARFYYDLALSTSPPQLTALLLHTDASKITFGTDFPYAPLDAVYAGVTSYALFVKNVKNIRPEVLMANVKRLLERHPVEGSALLNAGGDETVEVANQEAWTESGKSARDALADL